MFESSFFLNIKKQISKINFERYFSFVYRLTTNVLCNVLIFYSLADFGSIKNTRKSLYVSRTNKTAFSWGFAIRGSLWPIVTWCLSGQIFFNFILAPDYLFATMARGH